MSARNAPYLRLAEDLRENEDQWRAYESEGHCVILAGPGSGKTKTITLKIARLLAEDVRRPRRIACITYSNACAGELQSRLAKLGVDDGARVAISTVHSFCLTELVAPYAVMAGLAIPQPLNVATPALARNLFREAYQEIVGGNPSSSFRTACDKLRRTIVDRDSREWREWSARETRVVEAYETLLLENKVIDFDGLMLAGLQLVENHGWVRSAVCAKYPIVVIDEYQDLGLPLHRMVLALRDAGIRILAVGDPDQSIYGFTGAQPGLLRALSRLPTVEAVMLKLNYRCAENIIAASNALLPEPSDYRSHDGRQGEIRIHRLERNVQQQADYALSTLVPAMLEANPLWVPGDIALLYRSLNEGTPIASAADARGLSYFRLDNGSPIKKSRLTSWLTEAAQWCAGGWESGKVTLAQLLKLWRRLFRATVSDAQQLATRKRLIHVLFALRDGTQPLRQWLLTLQKDILGEMLVSEPGIADEREHFADLIAATATGAPLASFTVEIFGNQGKSPDQLNLMTLHSSKGLEFQAVIMVGLEEGVFPSTYDRTEVQLQEAARLFYVGVTRAKSQVHLTYNCNESPFLSAVREAV
jgi:superfamily I DNA/RNA helicase